MLMFFNKMSIKTKIIAISLIGPLFIAVLFAWMQIRAIRAQSIENIQEKSKAIVMMAEATREQMAGKLQLGIIKPFESIEKDKVLEAVPVVTAMQVAAINAEAAHYKFRAPKVNPRNPDNTPTKEELAILNEFKQKNIPDKLIVTADEVKYFKPVKLTPDCLFCHGDPRGEKDPTGGTKEGWKAGEIHGAFEIISSLDETNARINRTARNIIMITVCILIILSGTVWMLLQTNVITPLRKAASYIGIIAAGDLTQDIESSSQNEIGEMTRALNKMKDSLNNILKNISNSANILENAAQDLGNSASKSTEGAKNLSDRSISVAAAAEEMSANMNSVAAATEEAATNISLVSNATRDMSDTINEISTNTEKTQTITAKAVSQAESASTRVDELGSAAEKIGKVTQTITEISEQTNLLALNATIEAARAGEAGKGFAVVANEIKDLAKQTAEATFEIRSQIEGIQASTANTVTEIQQITKVIHEVNEIVVMVVAAVEEQNVTTNEIAENISQATMGIEEVTENVSQGSIAADEVAGNISQVSEESKQIVTRSEGLNASAGELNKLAKELKEIVSAFKL